MAVRVSARRGTTSRETPASLARLDGINPRTATTRVPDVAPTFALHARQEAHLAIHAFVRWVTIYTKLIFGVMLAFNALLASLRWTKAALPQVNACVIKAFIVSPGVVAPVDAMHAIRGGTKTLSVPDFVNNVQVD